METIPSGVLGHMLCVAVFLSVAASCSGGGGSASIGAGSGASVSDTKSQLTVPTGSFEGAVEVHVTEDATGVGDIGNVTALAAPVTLEFSNVQPVAGDDPMQLVIHLDADEMKRSRNAGRGIYAKIKMEGAQLASDGANAGSAEWIPMLGSLDPDAATLTVALFGGGEKIHVVPVAGDELKIVAIVPPNANVNASRSRSIRGKAVNTVAMGAYPWAIVCNNPSFPDGGSATCNTNDPSSPVMIMLSRLFEDSNSLAGLGFDSLKIYQLRGREIIHSGVPQVPAADVMERHNPETVYNVAYLNNANSCGGNASCYLIGPAQLQIRSNHLGDPDITKVSDDVIMHEMTHAVQAALCRSCFPDDARFAPMTEGTATTMGLWPVVGGDPAALAGKVIYNRERPWQEPVAKTTLASKNDLAYQMTQFFSLIDDGRVTRFPALFRSFNVNDNASASLKQSLLKRLDQALTAATGKGLLHHYIRVMALRNYETRNRDHYIMNFPIWEKIADSVKTFSAKHYFSRAPWADSNPPRCYNIAYIKSGQTPDLYVAVVGRDVRADRREGGTATVMDLGPLGNGNSVIYSNDGAKLYTEGEGDESCTKDLYIVNTNLEGTSFDKIDYEYYVGFD